MKLKVLQPQFITGDDLVARLVAGLHKIGLAMKTRPWRRTGLAGIGPLQVQVLRLLCATPKGAATVSTIARELSVKLPTASEVIKTLEEKHLLRRVRSDADNRVVMVHLTAKGRREGRTVSDWPAMVEAVTKHLSREEQAALLRTLVKLIRALQLQGEVPVARMCVSCQYFSPNAHPGSAQPHHCGFVDAPFGSESLRIDCPDYVPAPSVQAQEALKTFLHSSTA
jgi:DNA-binding MarR family transcriptional regulator